MMKRTLLTNVFLLAGCTTIFAQGLTNFTDLYIESGSTLYVETDFKNNTSHEVHNNGVLRVAGDFDNTGVTEIDNLVVLYGGNNQTITGTTRFMDVLEVDKSGGVATVASGTVEINHHLRLNSGTMNAGGNTVILSDPTRTALVDDFSDPSYNGSLTGNLRMQRFIPGAGFHYIGAAVNNASVSELSELSLYGPDMGQVIPQPDCAPYAIAFGSPYGNMFEWHEDGPWTVAGCQQSGWFVRSAGNMTTARGYAINTPGSGTTIEIGGSVGNTSEFSTVSYGPLSNSGTPEGDGWHLVSNPFPSPMVWHTPPAGFNAQAQIFQTSGSYNGTYQPILPNPAALIASQQAFFVRVSGGPASFALPQSYRSLGDPPFYKADLTNSFDIEVEAGGFADKTTVRFGNDGETNGFDPMLDANKLKARGAQPTLKTRFRGVEYSINSLNLDDHPMTVPMDLIPGITGEFKFTAKHLEEFDVEAHVYLEDLKLDRIQELTVNPVYTFFADEADDPERFLLHFRLNGAEPMFTGDDVLMYAHNQSAFVFLPELEGRAELEVFNALGDLVYQTTDLNEGKNEIDLSYLATGAYILRARVNDKPVVKKVIL
jgi:hypothetical protein